MSYLIMFTLCVQAVLIQSVLSQTCGYPQLPYSGGLSGVSTPPATQSVPCSGYGGTGTGQVGVTGDIAASGNTVVVGSVPVLGSVDFNGTVAASGSVSISGQCGCGCN